MCSVHSCVQIFCKRKFNNSQFCSRFLKSQLLTLLVNTILLIGRITIVLNTNRFINIFFFISLNFLSSVPRFKTLDATEARYKSQWIWKSFWWNKLYSQLRSGSCRVYFLLYSTVDNFCKFLRKIYKKFNAAVCGFMLCC